MAVVGGSILHTKGGVAVCAARYCVHVYCARTTSLYQLTPLSVADSGRFVWFV